MPRDGDKEVMIYKIYQAVRGSYPPRLAIPLAFWTKAKVGKECLPRSLPLVRVCYFERAVLGPLLQATT